MRPHVTGCDTVTSVFGGVVNARRNSSGSSSVCMESGKCQFRDYQEEEEG